MEEAFEFIEKLVQVSFDPRDRFGSSIWYELGWRNVKLGSVFKRDVPERRFPCSGLLVLQVRNESMA